MNQRISSSGRSYLISKSGINSMNKKVIRKTGNVGMIGRSIRVNKMRKGVGGSHSGTRDMNKMKIKVL